jgi:tRNA A-37 threonylcarbamoyl transferase component Bud32
MQQEVAVMKDAFQKGCPVVCPVTDLIWDSSVGGGYYFMWPVGKEVTLTYARAHVRGVCESLLGLHLKGFAHGDARLRNLIICEDGKLLWADMNSATFAQAPSRRKDFKEITKCILAVRDLPASMDSALDSAAQGIIYHLVNHLTQHFRATENRKRKADKQGGRDAPQPVTDDALVAVSAGILPSTSAVINDCDATLPKPT